MPSKILNTGILAHVDAGKTTLTEQLLYLAGEVRKRGSVDEGTAQTDWLSIERERGISVRSSSVRIERGDCAINIIDTPGHVDFNGEVERSLGVLDCAVLLVSAVEGIQAQTETLFEALKSTHTPTLLLINKIDRAGSNTESLLGDIRARLTPNILPLQQVLHEGDRDCGIRQRNINGGDFSDDCLLTLSEFEPELLDLPQRALTPDQLSEKLRQRIHSAEVYPVLFASAALGVGIAELLDTLLRVMEPTKNTKSDTLSAVVYKIEHDKTMGKIAHVRLFGGSIQNRDNLYIPSSGKNEKVTQIRRVFGSKAVDIGRIDAGDIAALCGLSSVQIGDVLGERGGWNPVRLAVPLLRVRVTPQEAGQTSELLAALRELCEEDPLLGLEYVPEEQEIQICITGTIQLEILGALLKERYNLTADFSDATVIYKETPSNSGEGFEAYTMPKPCWAIVRLLIEPLGRGSGVRFRSVVNNNDIFLRYQNHVETSVYESLKQGVYGWEVTDLSVTLIGGSHHTIHTHPLDFFVATPVAVLDGLTRTGTTLLEPVSTLRLSAPEEYLGKIIGELIQMRGEFDTPVIHSGTAIIEAHVPVATSLDFPVRLGVLTSGSASISARFYGYQECPLELGATTKRWGVNPLDRAKWILTRRNALS